MVMLNEHCGSIPQISTNLVDKMSKKQQNTDVPVNSTLIKSYDEVIDLIAMQIVQSEELLNMEVIGKEVIDCGPFGGRGAYWKYDEKQEEAFYAAYHQWDDMNKEIFTRSFADANNTDLHRYEYSGYKAIYTGHEDLVAEEKETIRKKVAYMEGFIKRIYLIPCSAEQKKEDAHTSSTSSKKVFIVHGHDTNTRTEVENFVRSIGYEPIILCKRADLGNTIIEKIEREAKDICYAIVIYTSCDLGKDKDRETLRPRARQNVVFEHGFMCAHLGRARVTALLEDGVEQPGDLQGVIYKALDDRGMWKYDIAKEMSANGLQVDFNKIG